VDGKERYEQGRGVDILVVEEFLVQEPS
jgi:hypothetical protein